MWETQLVLAVWLTRVASALLVKKVWNNIALMGWYQPITEKIYTIKALLMVVTPRR